MIDFDDIDATATTSPTVLIITTSADSTDRVVRTMSRVRGVLLIAADRTTTLTSEVERFATSIREFKSAVAKVELPREPQQMPYGWREPVAFIEQHRRRPRAVFACTHRAAGRDARRRRRTKWLREIRTC